MFDRRFMDSKLGLSALASIAAMITFNIMVATQHFEQAQQPILVTTHLVALA